MVKEIKIFDSICFNGDIEFLILRMSELDQYVDQFIIAEFTSTENHMSYLNNINLFEKWSSKINHVFVDDDENMLSQIKDVFFKLNPGFEDILMISKTFEIPNLIYKDDIINLLKFEPVIIEHKNLIWNYDYTDNLLSRGTMIFSFSMLLQNKNILNNVFNSRDKLNIGLISLYENGWKFSNFGYDENYEYQIKELLPPTEIDPVRTYQLIKHNGNIPLPKNLHLLPYFKIGRDEVKKHLFLVESDLEFVNQDYYDTITIINFGSNIQETLCEKVSDKITKSVLYLPSKVLYGNPETFHDEYMMNETKRMFSVVFPQEQDIIEVIFKNEKPLVLGGVSN